MKLTKFTQTASEKAEMTEVLKRYVAWIKENKVIAKGYADSEMSSISGMDLIVRVPTHFKFMIISANDTAQTFVDNWEVTSGSDSFKLKKGVCYDGYSEVGMDTNVANSKFSVDHGLRNTENMFTKSDYCYDINE